MSELFNVRLSLYRFLKDHIETDFSVPCYMNDPKTSQDEAAMLAAERYFYLTLIRGEYSDLQPFDVVCGLYQERDFDPACLWIRAMQQQIEQVFMHTRDNRINLIPIYDYDSVFGTAACQAFLDAGTYPSSWQNVVERNASYLPLYTPNGHETGLIAIPGRRTPQLNQGGTPIELQWTMELEYYEPLHQAGQWG